MNDQKVKNVVEAALLAAGQPLNVDQLLELFDSWERPERKAVREALKQLGEEYDGRGIELREVATGFRIQIRPELGDIVSRLWQERPPRYSRALMETLALIAYRQPITRGEIEEVRGVSVSTNIMRNLLERSWVRIVGHRDVPGRPALYATTREFLEYFGLKSLDELPPLSELKDFESMSPELDLGQPEGTPETTGAPEVPEERGVPELRVVQVGEQEDTLVEDAVAATADTDDRATS